MKKSKQTSIQFKKAINLHLSRNEIEKCQSMINLYWLGDKHCNKEDPITKKLVPKYPDKNCPELDLAHWRINACLLQTITIEIGIYGNIKITQE